MIKELFENDEQVKELIEKNRFQNIYLYIDSITYGLVGSNISTYAVYDSQICVGVIYVYFGSIQLMQFNEISNAIITEIANFIVEHKIVRSSGVGELINSIGKQLHCSITDGYIMEYDSLCYTSSSVMSATFSDLPEIAKLICGEKNFGKIYTYDGLLLQLKDRMQNQRCKNFIIKRDGIIVSHFATFAVANDIAVLSGMVTKNEYRGQGLGGELVKSVSSEMKYNDGITPILYCYEEEYYTWYQKLGYKTIGTSSKMEMQF